MHFYVLIYTGIWQRMESNFEIWACFLMKNDPGWDHKSIENKKTIYNLIPVGITCFRKKIPKNESYPDLDQMYLKLLYRFLIIAVPNSEHLSSLAPSIKRAKS